MLSSNAEICNLNFLLQVLLFSVIWLQFLDLIKVQNVIYDFKAFFCKLDISDTPLN